VLHGFESNYTAGLVRGLCENGVALRVVTSDADYARLAELDTRKNPAISVLIGG
jgi:hypothetical protein